MNLAKPTIGYLDGIPFVEFSIHQEFSKDDWFSITLEDGETRRVITAQQFVIIANAITKARDEFYEQPIFNSVGAMLPTGSPPPVHVSSTPDGPVTTKWLMENGLVGDPGLNARFIARKIREDKLPKRKPLMVSRKILGDLA